MTNFNGKLDAHFDDAYERYHNIRTKRAKELPIDGDDDEELVEDDEEEIP